VRTASSQLLGILFSAVPIAAPKDQYPDGSPLAGLDLKGIALKLCLQLKSPHLDDEHSLQIVKNLFYIGKCFAVLSIPDRRTEEDGVDSEDKQDKDEIDEGAEGEDKKQDNSLAWQFSKLSYQLRSAHIARHNRDTTSMYLLSLFSKLERSEVRYRTTGTANLL